ncbi:MAG: hypothetical protein SVX43_07245 [Cyanobacteriota bacterium]|nr:hypothetical protein [Cyanobacteriota bacterium]
MSVYSIRCLGQWRGAIAISAIALGLATPHAIAQISGDGTLPINSTVILNGSTIDGLIRANGTGIVINGSHLNLTDDSLILTGAFGTGNSGEINLNLSQTQRDSNPAPSLPMPSIREMRVIFAFKRATWSFATLSMHGLLIPKRLEFLTFDTSEL